MQMFNLFDAVEYEVSKKHMGFIFTADISLTEGKGKVLSHDSEAASSPHQRPKAAKWNPIIVLSFTSVLVPL